MHISYNGIIAVYTFCCPFAHRLKNIDKVYIEPIEEEQNEEPKEVSKRMRGIELHDQCAQYLKQETEDFPFITDTLIRLRNSEGLTVETTEYYDLDLSPMWQKPADQHYVSTRKDAVLRAPTFTEIFDAKFGSLDYGFSKHIDECEFFLACEASAYPEVGEWYITIHFPEHDYTIPRKVYTYQDVSRLQQSFIQRIDVILEDRFFEPKPTEARCRFCVYRSKDALGSGHCPYSVY